MKSTPTSKRDQNNTKMNGWRHPVDHRWRLIAWDGDDMEFMDGIFGGSIFLNNRDQVNQYTPLPPGANAEYVVPDLHPHEHLKLHPEYRVAFDARLRAILKNTADSAGPAGPLSQDALLERFDGLAKGVRRTLECEIMRWGSYTDRIVNPIASATSASELADSWADQIRRVRFDVGTNGQIYAPVLKTRRKVKEDARESRLLNDIPPPVITVSGNLATITRPAGGTGRIYVEVASFGKDPKQFLEGDPEYSPPYLGASTRPVTSGSFVSARIYGPDLDGEASWSALTQLYITIP